MSIQTSRVAEELMSLQERAAQLTQTLCVLAVMKEGDRIRAKFVMGGRTVDQVGVVRVRSDVAFFLELSSGALLLVEDVESLELISASSGGCAGDAQYS